MSEHGYNGRTHQLDLEVDIPLLESTDSASNVAGLVSRLLGDISRYEGSTSNHDILQALTIATSVRLAMARSNTNRKGNMRVDLMDVAVV